MHRCKSHCYILIIIFLFVYYPYAFAQVKPEINDLGTLLKSPLGDSSKTRLLNNIIKYYSSKGSDSATIYANQGLLLFTERKYKTGQAWMILALADNDDTHGSTLAASEKAQYALAIFKSEHETTGMAECYGLLSGIEDKNGNFDKAIAYLIDELNIYNAANDKNGILLSWTNIGSVYDDSHDTAKALKYYLRADSLSNTLPLSQNVIAIKNNLGAFYFNLGDTIKSFSFFSKVLQLSNKPEYRLSFIKANMNMGVMCYSIGEKEKGKGFLYNALVLTKEYKMPDQEATLWMNFAYFFNDKPVDTLISYIDTAYQRVLLTGNKIKERMIYDAYATLYERKNDYKEANRYLKLERALTDSMYTVNKEKEIANIVAVYDLKLSTAKVHELEILIKRNQQQKTIIISIAILIILLSGILFYYYRRSKHLNTHLEQGRKDLAGLNKMKDKLFSVIGHDMRGPIANIPVMIEMIESEMIIPEEYREAFTTLKEHADITLETLDKLLLLGKQYIKGENFKPEKFTTKLHIHKNIELVAFTANTKEITIEDHTPDDISVYADAAHFDFIIRNLLSNAIKFSFQGGKIEISAERTTIKDYIVFSVKDHGTGMDENTLSHIFTASVTSTFGTGHEKGNGIGLLLCKDFINLNNGKIWVESKKGVGTTFFFSLKKA